MMFMEYRSLSGTRVFFLNLVYALSGHPSGSRLKERPFNAFVQHMETLYTALLVFYMMSLPIERAYLYIFYQVDICTLSLYIFLFCEL